MTDEQLEYLAKLNRSYIDGTIKLIQITQTLFDYIEAHTKHLQAVEERMDQYHEECRSFSAMMDALMKLFAEVGTSLKANTDRTTELITKVESYFGDGAGLDQVN